MQQNSLNLWGAPRFERLGTEYQQYYEETPRPPVVKMNDFEEKQESSCIVHWNSSNFKQL